MGETLSLFGTPMPWSVVGTGHRRGSQGSSPPEIPSWRLARNAGTAFALVATMRPLAVFGLLSLLLASCGGSVTVVEPVPVARVEYRPVSILVEVYDPVTNYVWENAAVRIIEADQEWSQSTCSNPYSTWYFTDSAGQVYFDEAMIADARVGFLEDNYGGALLGSRYFEDEATVVIEVDIDGYLYNFFTVDICFDEPDIFVQLPIY